MKILYYQDLHWRGVNSENRVGDYYSDVLTKFKEILSLSQKLKCDFIISGGDNFDSPLVSLPITDEFIDLIEKNGIPLYSLWGNHEEIGHSWQLSQSTTLAHIFRRSKLIKHLEFIKKGDIVIEGFDYYHNIEQDLKDKGLLCRFSDAKKKIAIVHAFITEKPFLPMVMHTQIKDIETDFDLVICAHNHTPFRKIINDTEFINLGVIGRLNINEADIEPSVLFLDTDTMEIKIIKLKSAKPKEEVFDLKKIEETKKSENSINEFIASLETTQFKELDIIGYVKFISKEKGIDPEISNEIISRIIKNE